MVRRGPTAHLRDRLDGLALAFAVVTDVILGALAELHPGREALCERMRDEALGLVVALTDADQNEFGPEAINRAVSAVLMAFAGRVRWPVVAANDDRE